MEQLRKEVDPPQKHSNGIGVMLVASAAMLFAVAGSAFIVRARMAQNCCERAHAIATPAQVVTPKSGITEVITVEDCGEGVFVSNTDGTQSVHFNLCAPSATSKTTIRGVRVHRVILK